MVFKSYLNCADCSHIMSICNTWTKFKATFTARLTEDWSVHNSMHPAVDLGNEYIRISETHSRRRKGRNIGTEGRSSSRALNI